MKNFREHTIMRAGEHWTWIYSLNEKIKLQIYTNPCWIKSLLLKGIIKQNWPCDLKKIMILKLFPLGTRTLSVSSELHKLEKNNVITISVLLLLWLFGQNNLIWTGRLGTHNTLLNYTDKVEG
jgi:hypothetical protein